MLTVVFLLLFIVTPAVFWFYGKRFLGSQTHPAALFILTGIACFVLLCLARWTKRPEEITLLWVIVNFIVFALVRKIRQKRQSGSAPQDTKP